MHNYHSLVPSNEKRIIVGNLRNLKRKGEGCSDDLAAAFLFSIFFQDENPNCSLRGIFRIFGISYATVYGIFSKRFQGTRTQKDNKPGPKTARKIARKYVKIARKYVKIARKYVKIAWKCDNSPIHSH